MSYNATDSVLRRHYEQHLASGGSELAGTTQEGLNMAGAVGVATAGAAGAGAARNAANDHASRDDAHAQGARSASVDTHTSTERPSAAGGWMKVLLPLIALVALGWAALKFMGDRDAGEAASDATATTEAAGVADVDAIGGEVDGFFSSATESLNGVTDADSATAALPKLEALGGDLDGLSEKIQSVPEAGREPLNNMLSEGTGALGAIVDKVMALPGVGDILKPVLEPMMEKLGGLSG